jgi:hypothetical protein
MTFGPWDAPKAICIDSIRSTGWVSSCTRQMPTSAQARSSSRIRRRRCRADASSCCSPSLLIKIPRPPWFMLCSTGAWKEEHLDSARARTTARRYVLSSHQRFPNLSYFLHSLAWDGYCRPSCHFLYSQRLEIYLFLFRTTTHVTIIAFIEPEA